MGEIDDVHHAPDQRQSGGEQRVDSPKQQPADDYLDENKGHAARRCVGWFKCERGEGGAARTVRSLSPLAGPREQMLAL
jgi:hypothetical protein